MAFFFDLLCFLVSPTPTPVLPLSHLSFPVLHPPTHLQITWAHCLPYHYPWSFVPNSPRTSYQFSGIYSLSHWAFLREHVCHIRTLPSVNNTIILWIHKGWIHSPVLNPRDLITLKHHQRHTQRRALLSPWASLNPYKLIMRIKRHRDSTSRYLSLVPEPRDWSRSL